MPETLQMRRANDAVAGVRADLREHTVADGLRFDFIDQRISDVKATMESLREEIAGLKKSFDRIGWVGWTIAAALAALVAKAFLPTLPIP